MLDSSPSSAEPGKPRLGADGQLSAQTEYTSVFDLRSDSFKKAVAGIRLRAEHDPSDESVSISYADNDLLVRLSSHASQVIVGRRGTGKTHLLRAFRDRRRTIGEWPAAVYVDLRTLVTTRRNTSADPESVALELFVALLVRLEHEFLDLICAVELPGTSVRLNAERAWDQYGKALIKAMDDPTRIDYNRLQWHIEELVTALGADRFAIMLDEWVHVDWSVQPYFAEHLKRLLLLSRLLCLKVASIEFQSNFGTMSGSVKIGYELGPELSCDVDMDSYLVMDKDETHVVKFFAELLFNHLAVQTSNERAVSKSRDEKYNLVIGDLFSEYTGFHELVRASEGVARDFLSVFAMGYFEAYLPATPKGRDRIAIEDVRRAARDWYLKDKLGAAKSTRDLVAVLDGIITHVIGDKKARMFMVPQDLVRHDVLQQLFDRRLVHRLRRGWSHPSRPGERYDIFTIDCGAYVELVATRNKPEGFLFAAQSNDDVVVPFEDKRSIRRIVLDRGKLEELSRRR